MNKYNHRALLEPLTGVTHNERNGAAAVKADEAKIDFSEVWNAVRQGKWVILLTCVLTVAAMATYTAFLSPEYQATSVVYVDTKSSVVPGVITNDRDQRIFEQRVLSNELGILQQSMDLAKRVAERLKNSSQETRRDYPILREGEDDSVESIAVRLLERVNFMASTTQDMISIRVESTSPEEAAALANLYAEEYQAFSRGSSRASLAATKAFLEEQVVKRHAELSEAEDEWDLFSQRDQVVQSGEDGGNLLTEVSNLRRQINEAQLTLSQEQTSLQLLNKELERVEPALATLLTSSRATSGLESQINALDAQIAELEVEAGQYYAVNPPDLKGNESRIPELAEILKKIEHFKAQRKTLTDQFITQVSGLTEAGGESGQLAYVTQLKSKILEKNMAILELRQQTAVLESTLEDREQALRKLPRQTLESGGLERRIAFAEQWYQRFTEELQKVMIAEEAELGNVTILRTAFVPSIPVRPNVKRNLILGVLLGLGLGTGIAFLRRGMNRRLYSPKDVEDQGYKVIGVVPTMDKIIKATFLGRDRVEVEGSTVDTRLITLLDPFSPITENFRLIRSNLEFASASSSNKVILLTSPEMADGKTVTALNLAIMMAQFGRRTLLIDADLRRPAAHRLLNVPLTPGLADVLGKPAKAVEARAVAIDNLFFMPAGKAMVPSAELLDSQAMHTFLEHMRSLYDVVIVDSPPVLAVTDAVFLAPQCDATVVVVSANRTDLQALERTERILSAVGVTISGTIFNRFEATKAKGYSYHYSYDKYPMA